MKRSYSLVINYNSRTAKYIGDEIIEKLKNQDIDIENVYKITDSTSLAKTFTKISYSNPEFLILASGDGTISFAVDYLAGTGIKLCIIPLGTTNNFARSLNLSKDIDQSISIIKRNREHTIDLGRINDDYFANVTGIGISAIVAKNVKDEDKKKYGRLAYAIVGIKTLVKHKPFEVTISDKDKELSMQFETHQVIIANGRYHAGRKIADGASLQSRELVVFKLGGSSKLSFIWHMLDFYIGKRKSISHTSYLIAKNVYINTNITQLVELDGEIKFDTPIKAEVVPKTLRVIC